MSTSTFDVDAERLTVFHIGEEYLFTHYFDREHLFEQLQPYYDADAYRFEVPEEKFEDVRELLTEEYFEPVVVEDLEPYCVVIEKYEKHADMLRNSVVTWERRGHKFFLLKDELSVKEALEQGATRIEETEFALGL